eukprot:11199569-Lingulodinium_polyedra.AAC.1
MFPDRWEVIKQELAKSGPVISARVERSCAELSARTETLQPRQFGFVNTVVVFTMSWRVCTA